MEMGLESIAMLREEVLGNITNVVAVKALNNLLERKKSLMAV